MTDPSLDHLERRLRELPREAWDRPVPPPPPWPDEEVRARRSARRRFVVGPLAAGVASLVLLGAGVGAGLLLAGDDAPDRAATRVELEPLGEAPLSATGVADLDPQAGGTATVKLEGRRPNAGGDFSEVWLLGSDGELVSLGSVRVPESGSATLENIQLPVDPERFQFLDVSREPADGDPGHSSDSVLRGPSA